MVHRSHRSALTGSAVALLALGACGDDAVLPIASSNAEDLTFTCDPDALPTEVGSFQIVTFQNALGDVDPDSVEVRLTVLPDVSDQLTITPASGSLLDLGAQTIEIESADCTLETVELTFIVDVIGRESESGALRTRSFETSIQVINDAPIPPDPTPPDPMPPAGPAIARQLAEAMTMREFNDWPPRLGVDPSDSGIRQRVGDEHFGAFLIDLDGDSLETAFSQDRGLLLLSGSPLADVHGHGEWPGGRDGLFVLVWSAFGVDSLAVEFVSAVGRGDLSLSSEEGVRCEAEGALADWVRLLDRDGVQVALLPVDSLSAHGALAIDWLESGLGMPKLRVTLR